MKCKSEPKPEDIITARLFISDEVSDYFIKFSKSVAKNDADYIMKTVIWNHLGIIKA